MSIIMKTAVVRLLLLFLFYDYTLSLIIPEEIPTILSLIYSNIPPIKKGTDSRVGVGFRLGEHADFQVIIELGPQSETNPLGTNDVKRRRNVMFGAAMRGEFGPLAQAVARYQMERKIQQEMDKLKTMGTKLNEIQTENKPEDTVSSNWLTKWKQEMSPQSLEENVPLIPPENKNDKIIKLRVAKPSESNNRKNESKELTELYN